MKNTVIWLVFLCAPLISAFEVDFFANGTKANIFAPLPEAAKDLMYTEFLPYVRMVWNKTQQMDWTSKRQFLLGLLHSHNNFHPNTLNLNLSNMSRTETSDFNYVMQYLIDIVTDQEIVFKTGIDLNERVHHIDNSILSREDVIYVEFNYYENLVTRDLNDDHPIEEIIEYNMARVHTDGRYGEFMRIMLDIIQANSCNIQRSPQQIVSNLMAHLKLVDVHKYISIMFCDNILRRLKNTTEILFDVDLENVNDERMKHFDTIVNLMSRTSLEVKRCDPQIHIEGGTYTILNGPSKDNSFWRTVFYRKPSFSNIYQNSVVTGVQLVQKNNIMYIQIQEGHLLPNGHIDENSIKWLPIQEETCESSECNFRWKGKLSIDLNNVLISQHSNEVLTGIGFENQDGRLGLKVYSTPFNFTTGKLQLGNLEHSYTALTFQSSGDELKLSSRNSPVLSKKNNVPNSGKNQYITFTTTNSGSVIPFIDIQPVQTIPASPMSGASFYHKGNNESAGFLGIKLLTYNIKSNIKV